MREKRTLCQLLDRSDRVYLRLVNETVWDQFLRQAACEGFEWQDRSRMSEKKYGDVVVLRGDMTVHYLTGQAGRMMYHMDPNLLRVDFARYINHSENYILDPGASATRPAGGGNQNWHTGEEEST